jgi:hypothetical protein
MILETIVDDAVYSLNVPDEFIAQAEDYFAHLDRDMDAGWQMSREWVENPTRLQRCQIVADKLLTALETENDRLGRLMAGYLLSRLPGVAAVEPDIQGEIQNTRFRFHEETVSTPVAEAAETPTDRGRLEGMDRLAAIEQAGQDITKVFKVGKGYRFSVYDHGNGSWQDSPLVGDREEAERLRQIALKARFEALQQRPAGTR